MGGTGFPLEARLRHASDFRAVFAEGARFVCRGFVVIAARRRVGRPRLGLAIAKRRIPRAVDRNRCKRVLRESFRHAGWTLGSVDVVVLARSGTAAMGNAELFAQLQDLWPQIERLRSTPTRAATRTARRN